MNVCKSIYSTVKDIKYIFVSSRDNEKLTPTGVYVLVTTEKRDRKNVKNHTE